MNTQRWAEINRLFHEAAEMPAEARVRYLQDVCGSDDELRREVESLLCHRDATLPTLEGPAAALRRIIDPECLLDGTAGDPLIGRQLGPYRLELRLGAGGMGSVYRADRTDEFLKQTVAVKVLHRSQDIHELRRRFRIERDAQANLAHPHIVRLQDAGVTSEGLPYLVMEYIDGRPIDTFCDERRLTIHQRLELFQDVCAAVHFAHQNLVVHRDLKPGNILVTDDGSPKLLDFGIAKVLDPDNSESALNQTETLRQMLSLDYASPEQLAGEPITTATDIYSLGVILYELLVGCRPHGVTSRRFEEFERAVCRVDARRPSTRLRQPERAPADSAGTGTFSPQQVALHRSTSLERLARGLRGDLDNIVMMALRKEPSRRYASAQQLGEDIQRYLTAQPVLAQKDTLLYRTRKFIQRNRLAAGSALLVALALTGGTIATAWQAHVAGQERDAARLAEKRAEEEAEHAGIEAESANEIAAFLADAFLVSSPRRSPQEMEAATRLLARQVGRVRRQYASHPHLRANLLDALGGVYKRLHSYADAESLISEAMAIRREAFGEESLETARSHNSMGELRYALGDFAAAERHLRESLRLHEELPVGVHTNVSLALNNLAAALRSLGRLDEAESLHERALALRRAHFGDRSPLVAESLQNLGVAAQARGKPDAAIGRYEDALAIRREVLGESHPLTVQSLHSIAGAHFQAGKLEAAEPIIREVIRLARETPGGADDALARATRSLAELARRKGDLKEAGQMLGEALAAQKRIHDPDHPTLAATLESMAMLCEDQGDPATASEHWREVLRIRTASFPATHALRASALLGYGRVLMKLGRKDEAEPALREAVRIYREVSPPGDASIARAEVNLGVCLMELAQYEEARPLLNGALATLRAAPGATSRETDFARAQLLKLYEVAGWERPADLLGPGDPR